MTQLPHPPIHRNQIILAPYAELGYFRALIRDISQDGSKVKISWLRPSAGSMGTSDFLCHTGEDETVRVVHQVNKIKTLEGVMVTLSNNTAASGDSPGLSAALNINQSSQKGPGSNLLSIQNMTVFKPQPGAQLSNDNLFDLLGSNTTVTSISNSNNTTNIQSNMSNLFDFAPAPSTAPISHTITGPNKLSPSIEIKQPHKPGTVANINNVNNNNNSSNLDDFEAFLGISSSPNKTISVPPPHDLSGLSLNVSARPGIQALPQPKTQIAGNSYKNNLNNYPSNQSYNQNDNLHTNVNKSNTIQLTNSNLTNQNLKITGGYSGLNSINLINNQPLLDPDRVLGDLDVFSLNSMIGPPGPNSQSPTKPGPSLMNNTSTSVKPIKPMSMSKPNSNSTTQQMQLGRSADGTPSDDVRINSGSLRIGEIDPDSWNIEPGSGQSAINSNITQSSEQDLDSNIIDVDQAVAAALKQDESDNSTLGQYQRDTTQDGNRSLDIDSEIGVTQSSNQMSEFSDRDTKDSVSKPTNSNTPQLTLNSSQYQSQTSNKHLLKEIGLENDMNQIQYNGTLLGPTVSGEQDPDKDLYKVVTPIPSEFNFDPDNHHSVLSLNSLNRDVSGVQQRFQEEQHLASQPVDPDEDSIDKLYGNSTDRKNSKTNSNISNQNFKRRDTKEAQNNNINQNCLNVNSSSSDLVTVRDSGSRGLNVNSSRSQSKREAEAEIYEDVFNIETNSSHSVTVDNSSSASESIVPCKSHIESDSRSSSKRSLSSRVMEI